MPLLVITIIGLAGAWLDDTLTVALATGLAATLALVEYARRNAAEAPLSLAIGFVSGNVLVFCVVNAIYVHLTDLPQGMRHDLVAWLTATMAWCAALGAITTNMLMGRSRATLNIPRNSLARSFETVAVAGTIYVIVTILKLSTGYLNARWELANTGSFGTTYLASGITVTTYVFFFLLGARLDASLLAPRNLVSVAIVGLAALGEALSGGREFSLWVGVLFVLGASASDINRRTLAGLGIVSFVVGVALLTAVGSARTRSDFAFSGAEARVSAIREAATEAGASSDTGGALEPVVARVYEFSAQDVIDQCSVLSCAAGFENFERLQHVLLPRILVPNKLGADDGTEILVRDFGYRLSDYTAVPITLVADAFRRGGWAWVIVVGFMAGVWLRILASMTLRFMGRSFGVVTLALLTLMQFRGYTRSVPGFVSLVTYESFKQFVLLWILIAAGWAVSRIKIGSAKTEMSSAGRGIHVAR